MQTYNPLTTDDIAGRALAFPGTPTDGAIIVSFY